MLGFQWAGGVSREHKSEVWVTTVNYRSANKQDNSPRNYTSEKLYQALFERADNGIFIANAEGRYLEVNPSGCEMLGYTRQEILDLSIQDLIAAEDLERSPLHLANLGVSKTLVEERHLRHKDGHLLLVEINIRMFSDGNLLKIVRSITGRRQTEQNITLIYFALENVHEAAFLIDENAHFSYVNEESCRILGYGRNELLTLSNRPTLTSLFGRTVTRRSSTNSDNLFVDDP